MALNTKKRSEVHTMIANEIPALRRYAYLLLHNKDGIDDLVQDTLERALMKSDAWRAEGKVRSWLYRIQYSIFVNQYRKRVKQGNMLADIEGAEVSVLPKQDIELEYKHVAQVIGRLSEKYRNVLLLVAVEGASYEEVSEIMGIPLGTVKSRLARARDELRVEMSKDETAFKNDKAL